MIKIVSLNVRSLRSPRRRATLYDFLDLQKADIILVQECNLEKRLCYENIKKHWKGNAEFSGGNDNKCVGVGILTSAEWEIVNVEDLYPGRLLMLKIKKGDQKIKVFSIYASNVKEERKELFEILQLFILGTEPIIIGGDLNCTIDGDQKNDSSVTLLKEVISSVNLRDVWKACGSDPRKKQTWKNRRSESRIDYFFISEDIFAKKFGTEDACLSDHKLIWCELGLEGGASRKSPYWKLNTSLLKDGEIRKEFEDVYKKWRKEKRKYDDIFLWWDQGKKVFRNFFIKKSKEEIQKKKDLYQKLNSRLQVLFRFSKEGVELEALGVKV